jgi:hypothetical protein
MVGEFVFDGEIVPQSVSSLRGGERRGRLRHQSLSVEAKRQEAFPPPRSTRAPSRSGQLQDHLIALCAEARMVASLSVTAIANAISPYSIGVAALSSRVKRSSVAVMASLTIRAADIDSGRLKNIPTSTLPRADDERSVLRFDGLLTVATAWRHALPATLYYVCHHVVAFLTLPCRYDDSYRFHWMLDLRAQCRSGGT